MTYSNLTLQQFYSILPEFTEKGLKEDEILASIHMAAVILGKFDNNILNALATAHLLTLKAQSVNGANATVTKVKSGEEALEFKLPNKDYLAANLNATVYGSLLEYKLQNTATFVCL